MSKSNKNVTGCMECPITKITRAFYCVLLPQGCNGTHQTIYHLGREDKIHSKCPLIGVSWKKKYQRKECDNE